MVEVARRRDDYVPGHVHRAVVALDRATGDRRDHLGGADHGPPERVAAEDRLRDQVVHELLRRVLVHRDLLEHDLALGLEVVEGGAKTISPITSSAASMWLSGTRA